MNTRVSIVIVNWNSGVLLQKCVSSIYANHSGLVDQIIVVDNASVDESVSRLSDCERHGVPLVQIRNTQNRGFAAACNQGAALASSKYLLFLNPDAELLSGALETCHAYLEERGHEAVGVVGVQLEDGMGNIARSCAYRPSPARLLAYSLGIDRIPQVRSAGVVMNGWSHNTIRTVDHVIGAFFFARRSVFVALDGFDERFFVYYEDLDYSSRMADLGYRSVYLAGARARHLGGGVSRQVKSLRLFYSVRSRLLYSFKHFSVAEATLVLLAAVTVEPVLRIILAAFTGSAEDLRNTLVAYRMLYAELPKIRRMVTKPPGSRR